VFINFVGNLFNFTQVTQSIDDKVGAGFGKRQGNRPTNILS